MKKALRKFEPEPETLRDEPVSRIIPLRTETALSRFPIHRLSKRGEIRIQQATKDERGKTLTSWKVAHPPGPLAYKLDTAVINRRIDEMRNRGEIPQLIKIGSLKEICRELGLKESGVSVSRIREALTENAGALITARLNYQGNDGTLKYFEFAATRYGVIFTGEQLPSGKIAEAVYIELHPRFHAMLKYSTTRPLNYDYLKALPPASQRLYELLSFGMFGSLKHGRNCATMLYSWLCGTAPLTRYYEWERAKKQLYKIHKPHIESGYLLAIEYEEAVDAAGRPDWIIRYTPGPKARAEFKEFTTKRSDAPRLALAALPDPLPDRADGEDSGLVARLVAAGLGTRTARKLAADHSAECVRQLDALPLRDWSGVRDRVAWLRRAIEEGYALPREIEETETRAETQRNAERAAAEQAAREAHREHFIAAYHEYLRPERRRIEREYAAEYTAFAEFLSGLRLNKFPSVQREAIELGFFEEFAEEHPELGVMTFLQWTKTRV